VRGAFIFGSADPLGYAERHNCVVRLPQMPRRDQDPMARLGYGDVIRSGPTSVEAVVRVELRPSGSRFATVADGVVSRHSFSYGPHYDPDNVAFGVLVAHNDDTLAPGAGFPSHSHRGVEIVTWMIDGELSHHDDTGGRRVLRPGMAQRLSTGTGVVHSERNAGTADARYVQMWVATQDVGPPSYEAAEIACGVGEFAVVAAGLAPTGLAPAGLLPAGERPAVPLWLRQPAAALYVAELPAGGRCTVPDGRYVHLFVTRGAVVLAGTAGDVPMVDGDAARVTEAAGVEAVADRDAQLLAWVMDAEAWRPQ
jgi:redox-sensitive bicupin YhaK (pirin superfamily)